MCFVFKGIFSICTVNSLSMQVTESEHYGETRVQGVKLHSDIIIDKTVDANICKQGNKKTYVDLSWKTVLSDSINGFLFCTGLTGSKTDNRKKNT